MTAAARSTSFAFAKLAPRITDQCRAAGWTTGTPVVIAEPGDTIGEVLRRLTDVGADGHQRALLAVADEGQPGRWLLSMVDVPTPTVPPHLT